MRSYHFAKHLMHQQYQVEMVTAHNKPAYQQKAVDGIAVHYLPVPYGNEMSFNKRFGAFIKFVWRAIWLSKRLTKPDLVIATSTPLTVGIIALWIKWVYKVPYIFEVRDLWPEAPVQLGVLKTPVFIRCARWLERLIYQKAAQVVALSPGIEKGILHRCSSAKTSMIPNMSDVDFFAQKGAEIHENKIFTIGYFGAFGRANDVDFVIDLAYECKKADIPVNFILAGGGALKAELEKKVKDLSLHHILMYPTQSRDGVKKLLAKTDAVIVCFKHGVPVLETNSPNKFFEGLAAGKLCMVNMRGWLEKLVKIHACGIYIDPDKKEDIPKQILPFIQDRNLLHQYQQNARRLAADKFDKSILLRQYSTLIDELITDN